jgi:hypothetical protein
MTLDAFCPTCASPVCMTFAAMPDLFTVRAASLDDPSRYKPQMVKYRVRGCAWDPIDPALPKFDKMPDVRCGATWLRMKREWPVAATSEGHQTCPTGKPAEHSVSGAAKGLYTPLFTTAINSGIQTTIAC